MPGHDEHGLAEPADEVGNHSLNSANGMHRHRQHGLTSYLYIIISRYMDEEAAIEALGALAQTTRLETFRMLVKHEPGGVPVGALARALGVPQNTMSTHLRILANAGLIFGERHSRSIIYRADLARFQELTSFLVKDCCGGTDEFCGSLIARLAPAPSRQAKPRKESQ